MAFNIEEFEHSIQSLPINERIDMLEALRDSVLEDEKNSASISQQIDLCVMKKRHQEYLDGHVTARSWEEVKQDIRDSL